MSENKSKSSGKQPESTCMPDGHTTLRSYNKKEKVLVLEETKGQRLKTRTELYQDLAKEEKVQGDEDFYEFSTPFDRAMALAIDAAFLFGLYRLILLIVPLEKKIADLFLDKYGLQFMFGEVALLKTITFVTIAITLILAVVIPAAFFNSSLGKKITNQRIRGDETYSISLSQAFWRELVWKPLSIACVVGFILPFFDKKKKSLHDKISGTFIIKD